jgi:hypothetical protein
MTDSTKNDKILALQKNYKILALQKNDKIQNKCVTATFNFWSFEKISLY